jgi:predicted TIM-barrel fold metal-dependent hydrolase
MKKFVYKIKTVSMVNFRLVVVLMICLFSYFEAYSQDKDISELKLKDYRPVSIYKIPVTNVEKAKYPAIDIHTHVYAKNDEEIKRWIETMDACGIDKTIVLTGATGKGFDETMKMYAPYTDRFELWCGFDYTGFEEPGYGPAAVKELERCFMNGAKGVGEIMFKGKGIPPSSQRKSIMVPDDPRFDLLFEKCGELGIPVNIHVAEDQWMYETMDESNDGLINASKWHIKMENGAKSREEMLQHFEKALKKHPKTIFIAAHLANCCADLSRLGEMFDKYPNLYADVSARFGEIGPIPRFAGTFFEKYQDRIVYGTDMMFTEKVYRTTFRILETADEHFYEPRYHYHWPLHGFALSDVTLKKIYRDNALKILHR